MKGNERLLEAIGGVDPALVLAAGEMGPARRGHGRKALVIALAAALVLALGVTAYGVYSQWFVDFFAQRAGEELTGSQQATVENMTTAVGESQTVNGWTVTVDQAVAGRNDVYIKLDVTAPEGTVLDGEGYSFREVSLSGGAESGDVMTVSSSQGTKPDEDDRDNRATILWTCAVRLPAGAEESFLDGGPRTLTLTDLRRSTEDGLGYIDLAAGTWRFAVTLEPQAEEISGEIEFIAEPTPCEAVSERWNSAGEITRTPVPVTLTSFRLTSLGAACEYTYSEQEALELPDVYVMLRGGTRVDAMLSTGVIGSCGYKLASPIDLGQVDYVSVQGVVLKAAG